ncbi:MAG: sigma 54-interacting transcriptional regulator [Acidobacteriota bacterium]|nr:sigma 54-interacting transcriptional regulator [Acidobacteriota bacterium]
MTDQLAGANYAWMSRYEALLQALETISAQRDLRSLVRQLKEQLHTVVEFTFFDLLLYDPEADKMTLIVPGALPDLPPEHRFQDGPGYVVWTTQEPVSCDIAELTRRWPAYAELRRSEKLKAYCAVPLTTLQHRLGILHFSSTKISSYGEEEVRFIHRVASQIAIAIDNAINFESSRELDRKLTLERDHLANLLAVTNAVVSRLELKDIFEEVVTRLQKLMSCEFTSIILYDETSGQLRWEAASNPGRLPMLPIGMTIPMGETPLARILRSRQPETLRREELLAERESTVLTTLANAGVRALCTVPLISRGNTIGLLSVAYTARDEVDETQTQLLVEIAGQVATSIDNARAYREISQLHDRLANEKLYLEEELRNEHNFKEIVGDSLALRRVLAQVEMVAHSDSTVLIRGETGTGKELIARAIHDLSARRTRTLLKLNCAAIPPGLLESEMFGHERGAFTGAIAQRMGRIELADQGTLFLDEVGDLPLELQPKLLRVLQEREFERIGGRSPIHVNIRLIAATNRDLEKMVAERQYRSDFYYRLNVFPIVIPPLRERPEDIPGLVRHFTLKFARRMNRTIDTIPTEAMERLMKFSWPGNVRELENVIERAVILSRGPVLHLAKSEFGAGAEMQLTETASTPPIPGFPAPQQAGDERELLLQVLRDCNGVVAGPKGAAARLGISRSTLFSRLQSFHISPREVRQTSRRQQLTRAIKSAPKE